jgi:hypothetical protein
MHLNLGHGSSDKLIHLQPELSGVGLGFGVERPVITDMLVLAGNLTAVTSIALGNAYNKSLHLFSASFHPSIEA